MAKKSYPYLPMFVGDFMAATAEWEGEEQALYGLLLMHQWSIGHLPVEPHKLARLVKYDPRNFELLWPVVGAKFEVSEVDGFGPRLLNSRLEQHRAKSLAISAKNSHSGKKGAERKWRNDGERHPEDMANATGKDGERQTFAITSGDGNPSHPIPSHPIPSDPPSRSSQASGVRTPGKGPRPTRANSDFREQGQDVPEDSRPSRARMFAPDQQTADGSSDAEQHAEWEEVRKLYPPNAARQDWNGAEHAARHLVDEGLATWSSLREGVSRYAALCAATNRIVTNPVKFFTDRDKPWSQAWPLPKGAAASIPSMDELRARYPDPEVANG